MGETFQFLEVAFWGAMFGSCCTSVWIMRRETIYQPKPDAARVIFDDLYHGTRFAEQFTPDMEVACKKTLIVNGREYRLTMATIPKAALSESDG